MKVACRILTLFSAIAVIAAAASADELVVKRDLSAKSVDQYVDELVQEKRIVTDLEVNVRNGELFFDVTSEPNPEITAWVIQLNLGDSSFKKNSKKYADDGFAMPVHRVNTIDRKKLHSAVWVQDKSAQKKLILPEGELPESGLFGQELAPLNDLMRDILKSNNIPGGTLAVAHNGTPIFERGFGYSDIDSKTAMPAHANMRIASLSKPITAVAVLILVQEGKLQLDDKLVPFLKSHPVHRFNTDKLSEVDARWANITIRHVLWHSGGWDRGKSRDTMFLLAEITRTQQLKKLARIPDVVKYQLNQPLDFAPGTSYAYSNVGYCLLGRVIETVSGKSYEDFVTERILKPAGMTQTRLGKTRLKDCAPDETHYYTQIDKKGPEIWTLADKQDAASVAMVSPPYGQWDLEVMDSHGGWTSTAPDLVRFIDAIDSPTSPLLTSDSLRSMLEPPTFSAGNNNGFWYGLGWNVRNSGNKGGQNFWHTGSFAGTSTLMVRRWDGYTWAVLFNVDKTADDRRCADVIDGPIHQAVNKSQRQ